MTISAEQRQVLLERLAKAREAKDAKKASATPKDPAPPKPRKSRAKPKEEAPPSPTIPVQPPSSSAPPVQPPADQNIILSTTEIPQLKSPETSPLPAVSQPIPIPPSKSRKQKPVEDDSDDDHLSQKQKSQKKTYAKVVFYEKPSAKKMDKLMKQLAHETSESESESEDEAPVRREPPQIPNSVLAPQRPVHRRQPYNLNTQSQQRTDYLRQLALTFYS